MYGHLRKHLYKNEKKFTCPLQGCGTTFAHNCELQRHIRNVHLGTRDHKCQIGGCEKSFKTKGNLNYHVRLQHNGERPFKCTFENCEKGFGSKLELHQHLRTHTGKRLSKCTFEGCGKAFVHKGSLYKHSLIHKKPSLLSNYKEYIKQFQNKNQLKLDSRRAHNEQEEKIEDLSSLCTLLPNTQNEH